MGDGMLDFFASRVQAGMSKDRKMVTWGLTVAAAYFNRSADGWAMNSDAIEGGRAPLRCNPVHSDVAVWGRRSANPLRGFIWSVYVRELLRGNLTFVLSCSRHDAFSAT